MDIKAISQYSGCTDLHPIPIKFPDAPEHVGAIVWYKYPRYEKFVLDQNKDGIREILIRFDKIDGISIKRTDEIDGELADELSLTGQVAFILPDGRRYVREDLKHNQQFLDAVRSM